MPMFHYSCGTCDTTKRGLGKRGETRECPSCGGIMQPQLPKELNSVTMETKDAYRDVKHFKNQAALLKERNTKHHDKYEIAEKIDKYGMDEAKRHGWDKKAKQS